MRRVFALLLFLAAAPVAAAPQQTRARATRPTKAAPPKTAPRDRFPSIALFGAHVGEALAYRPFDDKGRARKDAPRALERLLRCRQTGAKHRLHPRLGEALYQIGRHFVGHRIEIFSGFRPKAYCSRAQSRHMTGSAIDFHVDGVDNDTLIAYLRKTFHPAGVGFYPHGVHVHLDLDRTADTYWIDPGPPAAEAPAAPAEVAEPSEAPAVRDTAPDVPPEAAEPARVVPSAPDEALDVPPGDDPQIDAEPRENFPDPAE